MDLNRFKPHLYKNHFSYFFGFGMLFLTFLAGPSETFAQCSISSAQICVGADDIAYVWVNGNPINAGAGINGVAYGSPVNCVTVPAADLNIGANVIAVQAYNSACCYNWATWALSITMSNGSTSNVTSSSNPVQIWNQPTASGPPPPNDSGAVTWWNTGYNTGSVAGWVSPVDVTYASAFYLQPAYDPITGGRLPPLGADLDGGNGTSTSGTFNGQNANASIYYRQNFTLSATCPTMTPVPVLNVTKSFLGSAPSGVGANQPVTYVVKTCNTGGPVAGPVTLGDSLYYSSSANNFYMTNICYKKWFDGTSGCGYGFNNAPDGPNAFGGSQAISWAYPIGFPGYGFCDSVTVTIQSYSTGTACSVNNDAVLTASGIGPITSNTVNFTTSYPSCSPVVTPTYTFTTPPPIRPPRHRPIHRLAPPHPLTRIRRRSPRPIPLLGPLR